MMQMAPMWWTTLYMLLISTLTAIIINLYFMYQQAPTKTSTTNSNPKINWKW